MERKTSVVPGLGTPAQELAHELTLQSDAPSALGINFSSLTQLDLSGPNRVVLRVEGPVGSIASGRDLLIDALESIILNAQHA